MTDKESLRNCAEELLEAIRVHGENSNPVLCGARHENIQAIMIARMKFQQAATPELILSLTEEPKYTDADGVVIIAAERFRQRTEEGFDDEHDSRHEDDVLALAAASYALPDIYRHSARPDFDEVPLHWPWTRRWWKPTPDDRIRELAKAGALIAAEIDRLLRKGETDETKD